MRQIVDDATSRRSTIDIALSIREYFWPQSISIEFSAHVGGAVYKVTDIGLFSDFNLIEIVSKLESFLN